LAPFSSDDSVLSPNGDGAITAGDAYASHLITESVLSIDDGVDVSAIKTLLNSSARRLLALEASAQDKVSYYHYDHIMNNIAVTDEAGEVAHQYSYYPFLALKDSTGGASEDQRVANGKETDQMTRLTDYGARYADLKLGRFISLDRYFDVVGSETVFASPQEATGAYIFTNNNPVSSIDQDGRFVSNIIGAVVVAIATAALEVRQYRADKALGVPKTGWSIAASVAKTIILGAGVGFLTSGASAVGTVAQLATEVHQRRSFERKGNDPKVAEAKARVRGGIVGAVVGAAISGIFAATGAVAAMNSLGSTGSGVMVRMAEGLSTTAKVSLSAASTMLTAGALQQAPRVPLSRQLSTRRMFTKQRFRC
jgi:RHS repeat-associated protein